MELKTFINEKIRPRIQADGGEIIFESLEGKDLTLVAMGGCANCSSQGHLKGWIAGEIKAALGQNLNVKIKQRSGYNPAKS